MRPPRLLYARGRWYVRTADGARCPITRQVALLLLALMGRPVVSWRDLMDVLWPDVERIPDTFYETIKCCKWKLNSILRPNGWTVLVFRSTSRDMDGLLHLQPMAA